jgi:hypothetical protein
VGFSSWSLTWCVLFCVKWVKPITIGLTHLTQNNTYKDKDQDENPTISLTHLTQNNTHKVKDQDENPTISLTHLTQNNTHKADSGVLILIFIFMCIVLC